MILLNFSHPLPSGALCDIQELTGADVDGVIEVPTQFDHERPFAEQARALLDSIELTPEDWQVVPLLVNLPSLNTIAALVLAEIHGRCGHFPAVLRLKPVPGSTPPRFEVAEVVNLQSVRDSARAQRGAARQR
jgi:hypothetical protein